MIPADRPIFRSPWFYCVSLFVLLMFFSNLGSEGIYSAQEGRTAIITRNMLRTGNYLEMQMTGGIPYEKPILHYWLCAIPGALFGLDGDPGKIQAELAVRLPSAIAAVLAVLGAALLAGGIYGRNCGYIAAVILATMARFTNLGRIAHIDILLTAAFTWAMVSLYFGYLQKRKANYKIYGFYLALAAGMMLKGPLPVILAGLVVLVLMIRYRDWKLPLALRPFTGGALFLAAGCSWFVFESIRTEGAFFNEFFLNQNLGRFTGQAGYRDGEWMSPFYYFGYLPAGILPWSPLAIIALLIYWKPLLRLKIRPESFFLLAWFVTGFIFFSLSALKRADYLLPVYPAVAILLARSIELFCEKHYALSRRWRWSWVTLALLLAAAFIINETRFFQWLGRNIVERKIDFISKSDGMSMLQISTLVLDYRWWTLAGAVAVLGIFGAFLVLLEKRRTYSAFTLFTAVIGVLFVAYFAVIDPAVSRAKTIKPFALEARELLPPGQAFKTYEFNTELFFFIDRPYYAGEKSPTSPYVITDRRNAKERGWLPENNPKNRLLLSTPKLHEYPTLLLYVKEFEPSAP